MVRTVKKAGMKGGERTKGKEGKGKRKQQSDRRKGKRKGRKGEEGKMAMEKKIG